MSQFDGWQPTPDQYQQIKSELDEARQRASRIRSNCNALWYLLSLSLTSLACALLALVGALFF